MKKLKVLICGDRKWDNIESIYNELLTFDPTTTIIIHGYADGADLIAHVLATEMGFEVDPTPAHWNHKFDRWIEIFGSCSPNCREMCGRPAGAIRNKVMLDKVPDIVIAFHHDLFKSKGTLNMVNISKKKGIKVRHISK